MAKGWACLAYRNANPFVGASAHDTMITVPAPPFQIPGKLPHFEISVVQGLWLGAFPSYGRGKEIRADDLWLMGRMSDAGLVVPHVSIPPSWFNVLTTLFGSSNAVFGSSGTTIACRNLLWGNDDCDVAATPFGRVPISLNLGCFDPFCLPTDLVVVWGTVEVGVTWADIVAALIDIAISIATDLLSAAIGSAIGALAKKIGKKCTSTPAKFVTGTLSSEAYEAYAKKAAATQGVRSAFEMSDDDVVRWAKSAGAGDEATESMLKNVGFDEFAAEWGDQWKHADIDQAWSESFEEALEQVKAVKAAGILDEAAEQGTKTALLDETLEELAVAIKQVAKEELVFAMILKSLVSGLGWSSSQILFYGNALGGGTEGGVFSFEGAGWWNLGIRRQLDERWGDEGLLDVYDALEDVTQVTGGDGGDDDYWFSTALAAVATSAGTDETADDDYWWAAPATGSAA